MEVRDHASEVAIRRVLASSMKRGLRQTLQRESGTIADGDRNENPRRSERSTACPSGRYVNVQPRHHDLLDAGLGRGRLCRDEDRASTGQDRGSRRPGCLFLSRPRTRRVLDRASRGVKVRSGFRHDPSIDARRDRDSGWLVSRSSANDPSARRRTLNERLRAEYIAGAEAEWRMRNGWPMTREELERVLRRYPGDT